MPTAMDLRAGNPKVGVASGFWDLNVGDAPLSTSCVCIALCRLGYQRVWCCGGASGGTAGNPPLLSLPKVRAGAKAPALLVLRGCPDRCPYNGLPCDS